MAETRDSKQENQPRGIAAAAIEGAKEGERAQDVNPDDAPAKLARPAPGMTKQPDSGPSSTNQYTGVTGAVREDESDAATNPDAADEPRER